MATKAFWSVFAVIAALTMTLTVSAYQSKSGNSAEVSSSEVKAPTSIYYFRFLGANIEADYKDSTKWQVLPSLPSSNPCDPVEPAYTCTMQTDDIAAGTRTALVDYLTNNVPSAKTYCNATDQVVHKQDEP